ncbi:MAG: 2Fe-2S iron-sulfur cluster-binding protein [Planctomycetota bacterium]
MPTITIGDTSFDCAQDANLRKTLLAAGFKLYNGPMKLANCRGLGTCGTCAVKVEGRLSTPTGIEKIRLAAPPHRRGIEKGLRLACQCKVQGDVKVEKREGWWGQSG